MTHFLPEKQLWDWSGPSYKKCTTKKKGRKIFYKCIERGDESLCVGDSAVFLSTETDQPYIGKIDGFWESYASMNVRVKWYYHPVETVGCPDSLPCIDGALFEACHFDENDIQTISHKCQVLSLDEYRTKLDSTGGDSTDLYYLAGQYDHINRKIHLEPDLVPLVEAGEN
uniref:Protein winged eye n=2 Tax=Cacopsylla melanoneura TaxID=428564 RepID=A0A8D8LQ97_9HEMI